MLRYIKSVSIVFCFVVFGAILFSEYSQKVSAETTLEDQAGGIVLYGHSLFNPLKYSAKEFKLPMVGVGWGGSTTPQLLREFDEKVLPLQPKILILNTGANFLVRNSVKGFERYFAKLIKHTRKVLPDTKIVWLSVTPSPRAWERLRKKQQLATAKGKAILLSYENAVFLDMEPFLVNQEGELARDYFADDGVHYNKKGVKEYKAFLKPIFTELWESVD